MASYNSNDSRFDGRCFLEDVEIKLQKRLEEVCQSLSEGQKEIDNMQEYYWENYTEMDEYGYEDYDNQQALLHQVNANNEKLQLKHRFEKMLDAPFFGRVDFVYDGDDEPEPFYIGIANFAEKTGMQPLIYDWRAPVSGLFYDFDKGEAFYEAPAGRLEGEIISKWQFKIKNGKMVYAFESDTKIDDDILKKELGNNSDVKLKNIVRTIQKEQNAIIRNTKDKILVIQGAAGSGKTSIALHRIAYLLYHDRDNLKSSNVLILSPNGVFADYISHILPELGEENIREMSFDLYAYKELKKGIANDCEDRYDQLERNMKFPDQEARDRFDWKQSKEFVGEMEGFLAVLEDRLIEFKEISFRGMTLTEEEMIQLFYYKFTETPLLKRLDAVKEYFIDSWETLRGRNISEEDQELLQGKFDRMYTTKDTYKIYNWLLEDCGCDQLPDVPYEKRKIQYEDVFPMLYLKYRLEGGNSTHKNIKHLVIDEMQDYSYLQYTILETLFHCKMTILGDRAQTLDVKQQDVLRFLPKILGKEIRKIVMNKSYRNTMEIAKYAEKISGVTDLELLDRHGKEVEEKTFTSQDEMLDTLLANLKLAGNIAMDNGKSEMSENRGNDKFDTALNTDVMSKSADETKKIIEGTEAGQNGIEVQTSDKEQEIQEEQELFETAALITTTEEEAFDLSRLLKLRGINVSYVDRDSSAFKKGLTVTTFYLAKGLEFDQVFAIRGKENNPLRDQAEYICATRALHELYVYDVK